MTRCDDPVVLDQWYAVCSELELGEGLISTRLLGVDLDCVLGVDGSPPSVRADGQVLPVRRRYGFVWTTMGSPPRVTCSTSPRHWSPTGGTCSAGG